MIRRSKNLLYRVFTDFELEKLPWVEHGFGTIASSESWPDWGERAGLKQIHSSVVVRADGPGLLGDGDALVTNRAGLFVSVRTADCVPILLADTVNHAVAAVHSGWRGSAANIVRETLSVMKREFGTDAANVYAAIGPCIQECCYEVSPEVARQFARWIPHLEMVDSQVRLNLVEVNRNQLLQEGVPVVSSNVECTKCNSLQLHSFRRDGEKAGRLVSAIRLKSSLSIDNV